MLRSLLASGLVLVVAGCGSTAGSGGSSAEPSQPQSGSPSVISGVSAADRYCDGVDEFIAASEKALKDPLDADTKALGDKAQELQEQANSLAGELIDDPDAITRVQGCTERLQEFNSGN